MESRLHYNKALCLSLLGRTDDAIAECDEAIDLDEGYTKALIKRGRLYCELEEYPEALEDYELALDLNPYVQPQSIAYLRLSSQYYVATSGFELCLAPSTFGAGGPDQNTLRIQHTEVYTPLYLSQLIS